MEKLFDIEADMPKCEGMAMEGSREKLDFLKDLESKLMLVFDEKQNKYLISHEYIFQLSSKDKLQTIFLDLLFEGKWKKYRIYLSGGCEKEAIECLLRIFSINPECSEFKELRKKYPYVKCRCNSDDSQIFVVPVRLLTSIACEQYTDNVLKDIEIMNVD